MEIFIYRNNTEGLIGYNSNGNFIPLHIIQDNIFKLYDKNITKINYDKKLGYQIIPIQTTDGTPTYQLRQPAQRVIDVSGRGGGGGIKGINIQDEGSQFGGKFIALNFAGAGVTVEDIGNGQVDITIPQSGNVRPASYGNFYKQNTQLSAINSDVIFDTDGEKTADIDHPSGTDIVINSTGKYLVTVKLNDNSADQHIYQLTLDGVPLPQSTNGKTVLTGIAPDKSIQIETIINAIIDVTDGQILRVNAPIGMGLDTPPLPINVPPVLKASITLTRIDCGTGTANECITDVTYRACWVNRSRRFRGRMFLSHY